MRWLDSRTSARRRACGVQGAAAVGLALLAAAVDARAGDAAAPLVPYQVEPITGINGGDNDGFAQTRDDYMWLSVNGTAFRLDGVRSVHFRPQTVAGFPIAEHIHLSAAADGALWLGFERLKRPEGDEARLLRYQAGAWRRFGPREGLTSEVTAVAAAADGSVWLGTAQGLARLHPDAGGGRLETQPQWPRGHVSLLRMDGRGDLFIATADGLYRVGREAPATAARLLAGPISALAIDARAEAVWVAAPQGLVRLRGGQVDRTIASGDGAASAEAPATVQALHVDDRGALWVGTTAGLELRSDDRTTVFTRREGLPDSRIRALASDRQGALWVGTERGGVVRLRRRTLWNLGAPEGLAAEAAHAVLAARDGSVWISTSGGVNRWRDGRLERFLAGATLPASEPRSISEAADGVVWIAARDAGVLRFERGQFRRVALQPAQDAGRGARFILAGRSGDLWIGWEGGGLSRARPAARATRDGDLAIVATYAPRDGLCPGTVVAGLERRGGHFWFGSEESGVTRIEGGSVACLGPAQGLPGTRVGALYEDEESTLWIGLASDGGLVRYRDGKMVGYTEATGLFCDSVHGIGGDGRGHLWTACGGGVSRIDRGLLTAFAQGREKRVSALGYESQIGMRSRECAFGAQPVLARAADGRFWFATTAGVTIIEDPDRTPVAEPLAVIEDVSLDGRPAAPGSAIRRTIDRVDLQFRFTSPSFIAAERTQFQYRLEGLDQAWSEATFAREASYRSVPPGRYVFRMRASDGYGRFGTGGEAAVAVSLDPVFYRTRAFLAACALAAAAAVLGAHRLRMRRLRARYEMVQQERLRLARELHDGLGQGFMAVTFHLEALRRTLGSNTVEQSQKLIERTKALVAHCHEEARQAIWDLRAVEPAEVPFAAQIEAAARASASGPDKSGPELTILDEGPPLPASALVRHEVEQLVREAVSNAVRHGAPGHIDIRIGGDERTLQVAVKDDGKGFEPAGGDAAAEGHFGLIGMHERARRLGGVLRIRSAPGRGTELELEVPRRAQLEEAAR